jgi:hypothetical protein
VTGLFKRGLRKPDPPAPAPAAPSTDVVMTSKVFPRFLSAVAQQPAPVLLDLGPVVGSNITFFGDRLACKIYVEDLVAEVESHAKRGEGAKLIHSIDARLTQLPESVDGILCWDLFDFLDRPTGQALAGRLARMLRTGGALHGLFGSTAENLTTHTRFVVEAEDRLRLRLYPATSVRRTVLVTRDIIRMFEGLVVAESVLLKSNTRESLFRKT